MNGVTRKTNGDVLEDLLARDFMFRLLFYPRYLNRKILMIYNRNDPNVVENLKWEQQTASFQGSKIKVVLSPDHEAKEDSLLRNFMPVIGESMGMMEDPTFHHSTMPKYVNALGDQFKDVHTLLKHIEYMYINDKNLNSLQFIFVCAILYNETIRNIVREISDSEKFDNYLIPLLSTTIDIARAGSVFEHVNKDNSFNVMATVISRLKSLYMTQSRVPTQSEIKNREKYLSQQSR